VSEITVTHAEIRKAHEKLMERKYCSSCHAYKMIDGGKDVPYANGKRTRWQCLNCHKKISERKYQSKKEK